MPRSRTRKSSTRRVARAHPQGVLRVTGAGYGFVQTAEGEFFVPASRTGDAFDGDIVEIAPMPTAHGAQAYVAAAGRPSGRVLRVLGRAHESVVGRYEVAEPFGVVVPEDPRIKHDIFTVRADAPHVKHGDIVRVRMTAYPTRREPAQGVVEEVLGHTGDAGVDVALIIARHKLETEFSAATLAQVEDAQVAASEALASGTYADFTDRVIFTVDPTDAKDFDDAVSIESAPQGCVRLGVHIADVSHYVPWNSSADTEARRRATSVYLVDRVIPMLPEKLSNDVCSLRPHEERRALSVVMLIDAHGNVKQASITPSVIRSCARLTYDQAQSCLDAQAAGDARAALEAISPAGAQAEAVAASIARLHRVACALHDNRVRRGGMDFESEEARVRLDEEGNPLGVDVRVKTDATALVEEAMIAANEAVARFLRDAGVACVYRVHEKPAPADLIELKPILQEFGYDRAVPLASFTQGDPFAIQRVLSHAHGRQEEYLVSSLVVRAMKRAVYADACMPHFGLASAAYAHFTSPIRRYPDLMVHRMVKVALFGRAGETSAEEAALASIAQHASAAERTAEAAARESQELKLYELLEQYIGTEEEGVVSGVAASGFFVRLANTAEGFVSLRDAGEYFVLDAARRVLHGTDTGALYRLGMRVKVRISSVSVYERRADFTLVSARKAPQGRAR